MRTRTSPAPQPTARGRRRVAHRALRAARLLNVIAAIVAGRPPSTSQATRATSVVVLPLPAGATKTVPGAAVAAVRWSGAIEESCLDGGMAHATGLSARALNRHSPPFSGLTEARTVTGVNEPVPRGARDHAPNRPIGSWRVARPKGRFPYARHDGASFVPAWTRGLIEMLRRPLRRAAVLSLGVLLAFPARRRRISVFADADERHADHRREQVPRRRRPRGDGLRRRALPARMRRHPARRCQPVGRAERRPEHSAARTGWS